MVVDHARRDVYGDETRLRTLLRFGEELKRWSPTGPAVSRRTPRCGRTTI